MKAKMSPDCYNPKCLNKETQCEKCQEHVELPFIQEKELRVTLRPLYPEKVTPPYMSVKEGYGYFGTMLYSETEDKVQCHICGELFNDVGRHIIPAHKIKPSEYREKFSLNTSSILSTPTVSEKRSLRAEFNNNLLYGELTSEEVTKLAKERAELSKQARKKMKYKQRWTVEMMNRYGSCPQQIEERFARVVEENEGIAPSWDELYAKDASLLAILCKRFKGYSNALIYFGFKTKNRLPIYQKSKKLRSLAEYGHEAIIELIEKFVDKHQRLPNPKDTKIGLLPDYDTIRKYFDGDWYKMKEFAWRRLALTNPERANDYDEKFRRIRNLKKKKDLSE